MSDKTIQDHNKKIVEAKVTTYAASDKKYNIQKSVSEKMLQEAKTLVDLASEEGGFVKHPHFSKVFLTFFPTKNASLSYNNSGLLGEMRYNTSSPNEHPADVDPHYSKTPLGGPEERSVVSWPETDRTRLNEWATVLQQAFSRLSDDASEEIISDVNHVLSLPIDITTMTSFCANLNSERMDFCSTFGNMPDYGSAERAIHYSVVTEKETINYPDTNPYICIPEYQDWMCNILHPTQTETLYETHVDID